MSLQTHTGTIRNISTKDFADRANPSQMVTFYSFQLEGNNRWFRTNKAPVPHPNGTYVSFVADGQNVDVNSFSIVDGTAPPTPAPTVATENTSARSAPRGSARDNYWADKEARDIEKDERYQKVDVPRMTMSTAVGAAASIVEAAIRSDALAFGNTAKSKRLDMLADFTEQMADRLYLKIVSTPSNPPTEVKSIAVIDEDE